MGSEEWGKLARLLPDAGVWASGKRWPGGDILRKGRAEARWLILYMGLARSHMRWFC